MAATRTKSARGRAAVLPFPGSGPHVVDALRRVAPTRQSLLVGLALLAASGLAYLGARETSVFAVQEVRVVGAPPRVEADVRRALGPVAGASLVGLSAESLDRRLAPLPHVLSASYDRAYPNTLVVSITPERPLLVLRRGAESWLVSARGRVLERLPRGARPRLPRLWVPRATAAVAGAVAPGKEIERAVAVLEPLSREPFPVAVGSVRVDSELTLSLRGGLEIRLGDATRIPLKLEVARRILPLVPRSARYVDVSVPARAVAASNPQVEG